MADTFSEISSESWFGRIGDSIKGIFFGIVLIPLACVLLFWNEGRAVKQAKTLKEGAKVVLPISADAVDAGHEGKLVHVTGLATTADTISDPEFGITEKALKLSRTSEMYQWKEHQKSTTEKDFGGGSTTKTTYEYRKEWSPVIVDSSEFKHPEDHRNPTGMLYSSHQQTAEKITVGAFTLPASLVDQINNFVDRPLSEADKLSDEVKDKGIISDGKLFIGSDPGSPQVGNQRVSFKIARPAQVSLIAKQVGSSFEPYTAQTGNTISMLKVGAFSANEMFAQAEQLNAMITWIVRLGGWVVMMIGFSMIVRPLSVLSDLIPFIGSLVEIGAGLVAFVLATPITLGVVAIAWVVYRPLLGIGLLVLAAAVPLLLKGKFKRSASPALQPSRVA